MISEGGIHSRWLVFLWQIVIKEFLTSGVEDQRNVQFFTSWSTMYILLQNCKFWNIKSKSKNLLYLFETVKCFVLFFKTKLKSCLPEILHTKYISKFHPVHTIYKYAIYNGENISKRRPLTAVISVEQNVLEMTESEYFGNLTSGSN